MSFHVGQKVVCVDDRNDWLYGKMLHKGSVYTVHAIVPAWTDGTPAFELAEISAINNGDRYHFYVRRFRPVKETDISIFTAMLAPTPGSPVKIPEKALSPCSIK